RHEVGDFLLRGGLLALRRDLADVGLDLAREVEALEIGLRLRGEPLDAGRERALAVALLERRAARDELAVLVLRPLELRGEGVVGRAQRLDVLRERGHVFLLRGVVAVHGLPPLLLVVLVGGVVVAGRTVAAALAAAAALHLALLVALGLVVAVVLA